MVSLFYSYFILFDNQNGGCFIDMTQKGFSGRGKTNAGIAAEQFTIGFGQVFIQHLKSTVETIEIDDAGWRIGDDRIQRVFGILNDIADFQYMDFRSFRNTAMQSNAISCDFITGSYKNFLSGNNAKGIGNKIILNFLFRYL